MEDNIELFPEDIVALEHIKKIEDYKRLSQLELTNEDMINIMNIPYVPYIPNEYYEPNPDKFRDFMSFTSKSGRLYFMNLKDFVKAKFKSDRLREYYQENLFRMDDVDFVPFPWRYASERMVTSFEYSLIQKIYPEPIYANTYDLPSAIPTPTTPTNATTPTYEPVISYSKLLCSKKEEKEFISRFKELEAEHSKSIKANKRSYKIKKNNKTFNYAWRCKTVK
jgi:hypothetical protein